MKITKLKSMMVLLAMLCLGSIAGCSGGCSMFQGAAVASNAAPVVVYAQRAQVQALATFDEFLAFEKENRALLNDPTVKAAADNIRANYKKWDDDLSAAIKAYQVTRSQGDADKVAVALNFIHQAVGIARTYLITKVGLTNFKPTTQ